MWTYYIYSKNGYGLIQIVGASEKQTDAWLGIYDENKLIATFYRYDIVGWSKTRREEE